uniref:Zinc finger, ZZ-type with EF hand domain 1 n=1 Tax=Nothobranchius rachovii TaxID=451742 RepID=A0A1A8Q997_9TELE
MTLLAFALARGSVAKVLQTLTCISDHLQTKYKASSLIVSMASVRLRLLYRNGKPLQLHLQACDVKTSVILSTEDQSNFQVTQMKIKVRKGAIGAKCGLVFAYMEEDPFDAEKHFKRFKKFDSWSYKEYKEFVQDNQLTRDMDASYLKQKHLLDFNGLSLSLFWNLYTKLRELDGEEEMKSRLCPLDIPHSVLLKSFSSLVELIKSLSSNTGDIFSKVDQESWHQPQKPVILRTWSLESPHNYENSRHETTIFACPGATSFELLVARLMGRLASRTLALKSPYEIRTIKKIPPGKVCHVQSSPLWKPILRHGLYEKRETSQTKTVPDQTNTWTPDEFLVFLEDFARWNPSQDLKNSRTELMRNLMQTCRKQPMRNEIAAGPKTDQAVNAIWAAMVYHTPALNRALKTGVNLDGGLCLSEEFVQVYSLADSIRTWMLEMKQRYLVGKMIVQEDDEESQEEVTMETVAEMLIEKSLLLFRFAPCGKSCHGSDSLKVTESSFAPLLRPDSISEGDFQPSSSSPQTGCPKEAGDAGYFTQLSDSGHKLGEEVRRSYHQLLLMLVEAVQSFSSLNEEALLPALSCVQTCLLHLLDINWEVQDLPLFLNIKLPELLLSMSQENISIHDVAISQWTEEDEIADYKKNQEWMDECMDGMFEKWYDKIDEDECVDDRRKMHMFIARYCDLLNVVISCDGCERMAPWHRYRCLQCLDMDLCKTCFLSGAKPEGHEDDHEMVNMEYACDHCQGLIVGSRINCNVCEDFDLCYGCYNAKKYPDSHLPTHRITVFPMVTIRISDRHRLIQPYIHNYSWLLFAALALYTSELCSEKQTDRDDLDSRTLEQASALQTRCSRLITDCLLKRQTGKGLRSSALIALLSSNESVSESEMCPASPETSQELSTATDTSSLPGSTAAICSPSSPRDKSKPAGKDRRAELSFPPSSGDGDKKKLVAQDTLDSASLSQTPSVSSEDPLSPVVRTSESGPEALNSPASDVSKETDERLPQVPPQEHVFSECSRERILGLLAAMLPPAKPCRTMSLPSLSSILPHLFRAVISNAGSLNKTFHLTLGLLGQLLLRITPTEADAAITEALADKYDLLTQGEVACSDTQGWKTTQLLFCLGAACLDSRIGLDWACTVADILHSLNACPEWSTVIAAFTDHCAQQLPHSLKRINLFTLLVLVGFPEVLCVGTHTVFIDNANEQHNMILLKHFTEKNHAAVVDVKTRKRKTVKDYQLIQSQDSSTAASSAQSENQGLQNTLLSRYLSNFTSVISHLLQTSQENGSSDAVEASWVLSLALKGLYNTLKKHGVESSQEAIRQSGLTRLLVRKCSKGTGFSKLWLLRDLEILSIMLYSSKREIHSMAQDSERDQREQEKEHDSDHSSSGADDADVNRPDPLEGLDEETKICFQITHDALNAPLPILRAMYELQMKRTDSFFLEVQKRFDGEEIKTDETIRTLAQKWQPSRRPRSEERNCKAVDTDMIVVTCMSKPSHCEKATEEINVAAQKLITNSESDLQLSYAKQRRSKSSALLHKELDVRSNRAVRQYLVKVNQAIATLYARHVLAHLLADWPAEALLSEEALELNGSSHMAYILDMLMQLEERPLWEKILQRVLKGCSQSMLSSLSLTACQFMEEPGMAVQVRESKHPYDNNTNFEDKVHIPGAIYLSVKFDSRCHTEEGCDELIVSSSSDFLQDVHNFSGSPQKWSDFEVPGDTLYYRFMSDMSNTEWGYKFTVTGGHRGRFQTGFEILKQMLADDQVLGHLPLADIWEWQVGVACRQTGNQRLKAIHLLLRLLQCPSQTACELLLLRPLWQLFMSMENNLSQDPTSVTVLLPLHRALTELFFTAEARAITQGILQEYLLAMTTHEQLLGHTAMALKNIAAISLAISYPNKSTKPLNMSS